MDFLQVNVQWKPLLSFYFYFSVSAQSHRVTQTSTLISIHNDGPAWDLLIQCVGDSHWCFSLKLLKILVKPKHTVWKRFLPFIAAPCDQSGNTHYDCSSLTNHSCSECLLFSSFGGSNEQIRMRQRRRCTLTWTSDTKVKSMLYQRMKESQRGLTVWIQQTCMLQVDWDFLLFGLLVATCRLSNRCMKDSF